MRVCRMDDGDSRGFVSRRMSIFLESNNFVMFFLRYK